MISVYISNGGSKDLVAVCDEADLPTHVNLLDLHGRGCEDADRVCKSFISHEGGGRFTRFVQMIRSRCDDNPTYHLEIISE